MKKLLCLLVLMIPNSFATSSSANAPANQENLLQGKIPKSSGEKSDLSKQPSTISTRNSGFEEQHEEEKQEPINNIALKDELQQQVAMQKEELVLTEEEKQVRKLSACDRYSALKAFMIDTGFIEELFREQKVPGSIEQVKEKARRYNLGYGNIDEIIYRLEPEYYNQDVTDGIVRELKELY